MLILGEIETKPNPDLQNTDFTLDPAALKSQITSCFSLSVAYFDGVPAI